MTLMLMTPMLTTLKTMHDEQITITQAHLVEYQMSQSVVDFFYTLPSK